MTDKTDISKKTLLYDLFLDEISLCDVPANSEATITLFKRDEGATSGKSKSAQLEENDMSDKTIADLTKRLDELTTSFGDLSKANDALTTENAELKKQLEAKDGELTEANKSAQANASDEDFLKSLDPAYRKRFEALMKSSTVLEERLHKMEADKLEKAFIAKAESFAENMAFEPSEFGPVLQRLSLNKATAEDITELERVLTASNEMLGKSDLFHTATHGATSASATSANNRIDAAAQELMKSDANLTKEMAVSKVLEIKPELYGEYLASRQVN